MLGFATDTLDRLTLSGVACTECGGLSEQVVEGDEVGMANEWTVEVRTHFDCPHCGQSMRWTIEEELLHEKPAAMLAEQGAPG